MNPGKVVCRDPGTAVAGQLPLPDEKAAGYYLNFGFDVSPDNPLLLFLSVKGPQ